MWKNTTYIIALNYCHFIPFGKLKLSEAILCFKRGSGFVTSLSQQSDLSWLANMETMCPLIAICKVPSHRKGHGLSFISPVAIASAFAQKWNRCWNRNEWECPKKCYCRKNMNQILMNMYFSINCTYCICTSVYFMTGLSKTN